MLDLFRDLVAHKGHANAALLTAIRAHDAAMSDAEILTLLHHVLVANRFWLLTVSNRPFRYELESRPAESFDALVQRFRDLQVDEQAWLASATPAEFDRLLSNAMIPNGACTVGQALTQVCLHTHGHRAQLAKMLRRLGGTPPANEFISWVGSRPSPEWPAPPGD